MTRFTSILISTFLITTGNCWASGENADRFSLAIESMKLSCVSGEGVNIKDDGEGGVTISKAGAEDSFSFSKAEVKRVITSANDQIRSESNPEIRQCMQPYVQAIVGILATPVNKSKLQESLPTKQWIPIDMPMPILDGNPLLTLAKVYESGRDEVIDLVIEVPHRSSYLIKLYQSTSPNRKNFDTFKYRDTIYKIVADRIDLQGQRAQISVINYKKAM